MDAGEILHLSDALSLYVHSTTATVFTVPACTDAGVPIDSTDASAIDIPAGESVFNSTAAKAGVIPEGSVPLFMQLYNGSGGESTNFIYIIKRPY